MLNLVEKFQLLNHGHIEAVIQEVIAAEKSKVLRNEITEGTFRINAVRLNTHIYQFFKTKVLSDIDTDTIAAFVEYLTAQHFTTPTIIGYLSNFKKVTEFLYKFLGSKS